MSNTVRRKGIDNIDAIRGCHFRHRYYMDLVKHRHFHADNPSGCCNLPRWWRKIINRKRKAFNRQVLCRTLRKEDYDQSVFAPFKHDGRGYW